MGLLSELSEFLGESDRNKSVSVKWQTHEQARYEMNRKNDMQFAKALYRFNTETDPDKKAKISALMTAGIYDVDNHIDEL